MPVIVGFHLAVMRLTGRLERYRCGALSISRHLPIRSSSCDRRIAIERLPPSGADSNPPSARSAAQR